MAPRPERYHEQNRRTSAAQQRAFQRLRDRYPGVWRKLYEEAVSEVNAERGPLPLIDNKETT